MKYSVITALFCVAFVGKVAQADNCTQEMTKPNVTAMDFNDSSCSVNVNCPNYGSCSVRVYCEGCSRCSVYVDCTSYSGSHNCLIADLVTPTTIVMIANGQPKMACHDWSWTASHIKLDPPTISRMEFLHKQLIRLIILPTSLKRPAKVTPPN